MNESPDDDDPEAAVVVGVDLLDVEHVPAVNDTHARTRLSAAVIKSLLGKHASSLPKHQV